MRLIRERFRKKNRLLSIDEEGILAYARRYWTKHKKMRWNGRQIWNACQTALAEFDAGRGDHEKILDPNAEVKLTVGHLKTVAHAYREFMWYLNKLYKTDQERLAHRKGFRTRELDGKAMETTDEEIGPDDSDDASEGESHPLPQQPSTLSQSPSTLVANPQMGAANPGPAYPGGVPGNYLPAASQAQAGYGYFNPLAGQQQQPPLNPQQNALMWQNINPALYQQYLLQGQMPGTRFSGVMPGVMPGSVSAQHGFMGDGLQRKP